ncbi:hypothetical protein BJ165DRAFT_376255 [Panaeolus papilionaceus]|nr:hypothetical protein BJ165DRAFT_376255 [Panaeolus papilionaceus]
MGHQYRGDFHPRVQFTLQTISVVFLFVERVWTTYYFYDLSSTVGLSTIGTTLLGIVWILDYFWETIAKEIGYNRSLAHIGWRAIFFFVPQITALCMLKAALRVDIELYRNKPLGIIPRVHFSPPSHRERASRRIESRVH